MPAYQPHHPHTSQGRWDNYSRSWEPISHTTEAKLTWDRDSQKFTGFAQMWSHQSPQKIEVTDVTKSIELDRWTINLTFTDDWETREAMSIAKGKCTYRHGGWCIVHGGSSYVKFYDMENIDPPVEMHLDHFAKDYYFFSHYDVSEIESFKACCHTHFE